MLGQTKLKRTHDVAPVALVSALILAATSAGLLTSCKQMTQATSSATSVDSDAQGDLEILTALQNTSLKTTLFQADGLGNGAVCPIPQGTILTADSIKPEGIGHWRVSTLMEVKLPSGEVGRAARNSDETPSTGTQETTSTSPAATAIPAPQSAEKTPAQLLGCEMLNAESFLVYGSHFKRNKILAPSNTTAASDGRETDASDNGAFVWPTKGKKIRNDSGGAGYFNAPRASGRGHQGIDIVAAVGEAIYATRAGIIIDPAYEYSYGRVMDVKHSQAYSSRYAHLNSFTYSHGVFVEKGAKIATSGRSGNASGYGITPHLHFEVRQYGRLLNPMNVLP